MLLCVLERLVIGWLRWTQTLRTPLSPSSSGIRKFTTDDVIVDYNVDYYVDYIVDYIVVYIVVRSRCVVWRVVMDLTRIYKYSAICILHCTKYLQTIEVHLTNILLQVPRPLYRVLHCRAEHGGSIYGLRCA